MLTPSHSSVWWALQGPDAITTASHCEFAVFEGYACYAVAFGLQSNCFALTNLRAVALGGAG